MAQFPTPTPTLFSVPERHRSRTSDVLLALVDRSRLADVTLRTLTERLGDRTFGMLLIILAVFNVIPFVSLLSGLLVVILGLQMAVGMKQARLPKFILDRQLPPEGVRTALLSFVPKVQAVEKYIRPRWQFTEAPVVDCINGLVLAALGCVIALPVPFTNLIPAVVIIIMGLGLLERDGLMQVVAASLGIGAISLSYYLIFS